MGRILPQRIKCALGDHPEDRIVVHSTGHYGTGDYGHYECDRCGRKWGFWDDE